MSDEAFAAALAKAKAEGRESVHVRAWLPIPAECLAQSEIELQCFTEQPGRIADANAPQRTVCWEADLTENRRFGVQYRYKTTAVYADPLDLCLHRNSRPLIPRSRPRISCSRLTCGRWPHS